MKKRLHKKGAVGVQMVLEFIMELVLGGMVLLTGFAYVNAIIDSSFYDKIYFSRDIAVTINAIYSAPGMVDYIYHKPDVDMSKYQFEIKSGLVGVSKNGVAGDLQIFYPFGVNAFIPIEEHTVYGPYKLEIKKDGKGAAVE